MNQVWSETRDGGCLQRPSVAVSAVRLLKQAERFHGLARKELPPTGKEQLSVSGFICDLCDCAASGTDIAVVSVQDENSPKSKMKNVSMYVCKIHRHNFWTNADRATKVSRMRRALREAYRWK